MGDSTLRVFILIIFGALFVGSGIVMTVGFIGVEVPGWVGIAGGLAGSGVVAPLTWRLVGATQDLAASSSELKELTKLEQGRREAEFVVWPADIYHEEGIGVNAPIEFCVANKGWKDSAILVAQVQWRRPGGGQTAGGIGDLRAVDTDEPADRRVIKSGEIVRFHGKIPMASSDDITGDSDAEPWLAVTPVLGRKTAYSKIFGPFAPFEEKRLSRDDPGY